MKVVLVSLNSQYIHSSLAPWCLLSGIRAFADPTVQAQVVEGTVNEPTDAVIQRIVDQQPSAVGFCCYIWNITQVEQIAAQIKQRLPQCFVFFGGPEVSYRAGAVLAELPFADAVVGGEGERPVAYLLSSLADGRSVAGIDGVSYRNGETIVESAPFLTDEEPPSPYLPEYFEQLNGRIAYLETSRGCPFSCAFCLSGRCGGVRVYSMERVKRELLLLANSGTQTVKLVDRTFNADRARAREIFRFLMDGYGTDYPKTVCFHFEIGGDLLDEETLTLLSEAPRGLFQMEIGLQSFHEPTLAAVCRKTDTARLTDAIRKLVSGGNIHVHIDLIAGLPHEDLTTFIKGFEQALALKPQMLQLGFLKLLHGAPMREHADRYPCRYSSNAPYEVLETPWMSGEDLSLLHRVEDVLDRLYNSGRFRRTLSYLMQKTQRTAFEVLRLLADHLGDEVSCISLDAYTERIYACFSAYVDANELRDVMVCDRLAANPSALLPSCLRRLPEQTKALKAAAQTHPRFARPKGVRRGAACLCNGKTLVYADQQNKNPVTGEYPLHFFEREMLNRPYHTLLFDLDGTLTDPVEGIVNSVAYALDKFGITVEDKTTLHRFIGPPLVDSFRDFYGFTDEQARQALAYYREYYATTGIHQNRVYDGMRELLYDLRQHGYRLMVATSKPEMYARRIFDVCGLAKYFEVIAGSDMAEKRAEKAQVVAYALSQSGTDRYDGFVMIGDRRFDVEGARTQGLPCVGVLFGYGDRAELEQAGARHIVASVRELRDLLL